MDPKHCAVHYIVYFIRLCRCSTLHCLLIRQVQYTTLFTLLDRCSTLHCSLNQTDAVHYIVYLIRLMQYTTLLLHKIVQYYLVYFIRRRSTLKVGVPYNVTVQAGVVVWVLTGDKQETAINIAFSCRYLVNYSDKYSVQLQVSSQLF